jgi:hypothetical protein
LCKQCNRCSSFYVVRFFALCLLKNIPSCAMIISTLESNNRSLYACYYSFCMITIYISRDHNLCMHRFVRFGIKSLTVSDYFNLFLKLEKFQIIFSDIVKTPIFDVNLLLSLSYGLTVTQILIHLILIQHT